VCELLQSRNHYSATKAKRAVAEYRRTLANAGVGDILYHSPIDETTDGIVNGEYGLVGNPSPKKKPKKTATTMPTLAKRARKKTRKSGKPTSIQIQVGHGQIAQDRTPNEGRRAHS
jgi:hypothetical protein